MTKRTNGKWPDGTARSQCNAFTQAWGGQRIDVGKLATNDRISRNATKTVVRKAKLGLNIGTIPGMSRKATEGARTRKAPEVTKKLPWMAWDIPAYLADTRSFSAEQHGAYLMLLAAMWMERGSLANDDEDLAKAACCTPDRWEAIKGKVLAKFTLEGGVLTQKRLSKELARAGTVSNRRSKAGKEGAAKRWQKDGNDDGKRMANAMANASQNDAPPQSQSHSTNVEGIPPDPPDGVSGGAPRAPREIVGSVSNPPEWHTAKPTRAGKAAAPEYSDEFERAWRVYPKRAGENRKPDAWKAWSARIKEGADPEIMLGGVERYTAFIVATDKVASQFVKQAATFFGPQRGYLEPWTLPARPATPNRQDQQRATLNGLGTPYHGENHGTDRQDPIDVQARVVPDAA